MSATASSALPGKIEPARVVRLQGQRGLGLLQGLVVFSQFRKPHAVDVVRAGRLWPWPAIPRSSPPCTSRLPPVSAREENARPSPCCSRCRRVRVSVRWLRKSSRWHSSSSPQRNQALPQQVQDVDVAGQFFLEHLQVVDGIRAPSLGHVGIDHFPPHPLNRRHVRRGLLLERPHQFFQTSRYALPNRPEARNQEPNSSRASKSCGLRSR